MRETKTSLQQKKIVLKTTHRYCNGERLDYVLYGKGDGKWDRFFICVKGFGEQAETAFSDELPFALTLFDKLVEGAVLPCVLAEIVKDQLTSSNLDKTRKN